MKQVILMLICVLLFLTSCGQVRSQDELKNVGLLVPETIMDQGWGSKAYRGILQIQSSYGVDVYYKEGMNTKLVVERAVKEFDQKGVNLIFGQGHEYAEYFSEISLNYPDIHFITFNGDAKNDNVTSLHFESYAMGFFAGMVAAHMTKSNHIGIIPAFEWQPEIKGFYDGAKYENNLVSIEMEYVNDFDDEEKALNIFNDMHAGGVDIIYPTGAYSVPVIEKVKENGIYGIGYISDQSDVGNNIVLTSTVQHVEKLYEWVANRYNKGHLESGNISFDFKGDAISLGTFSPLIDETFVKEIQDDIERYKKTGELPNQ